MENTTNKRIRPTPTERKQVNSKLSHEAYDWANNMQWELRGKLSFLINKTVEFAMKNEEEFIAFYNDTKTK